jgi:hypothetical protein
MRADRQLADYIRLRHESSDYTQHLGIIARVRADFRQLSTLLRAAREESRAKEQEGETPLEQEMKLRLKQEEDKRKEKGMAELFPRIDRIVLYIDDLDRCPEKNVVEVLQAVHLLLAFPLFVVVVGVDPRWLLYSLQQSSSAFQKNNHDSEGMDSVAEEDNWHSTPLNYLEKIFQIPFSLRPIGKEGFKKIVETFAVAPAPPPKSPESSLAPTPSTSDQKATAPGVGPGLWPGGTSVRDSEPISLESALLPVLEKQSEPLPAPPQRSTPQSTPIDRNPEHLQFRKWEQTFMKELHEFIPSPRAAKRFINTYRLLRASVRENERAAFDGNEKGGTHQAAMLLLAILTGYPDQATEILRALIEDRPSKRWREFIAAVKAGVPGSWVPRKGRKLKPSRGRTRSNASLEPDAFKDVATKISLAQKASWFELFERLESVNKQVGERSCKEFCEWAPRVARYSFQSGRVLRYLDR